MRYLIGVDGGQTSTLAVVAGDDGSLLSAGRGGPANHLSEPGGPERLKRSLSDAIGEALDEAGLRGKQLAAACFGMTGGGELVRQYMSEIASVGIVRVEHDSVTALAGGTAGGPGVVVIAGTGSVALGIDEHGNQAAVGGWGYVMGDEGSGHDVAIWALRAATGAADGRLPPTELTQAIPAHFGLADLRELHRLIYSGSLERPRLAEISRVVGELAAKGDAASLGILEVAAEDLALTAAAVIARLGALDRELPVVYVGGVFRAGPPLLEPFVRAMARRAPKARVQPPRFPPVVGAVILAFQAAGVPLDEARFRRLEATIGVATSGK